MIFEITSFKGALSDYDDKGIPGSFKFGSNLDVRKQVDSLSAGQTLVEEGLKTSASSSPSLSLSLSPSVSISKSPSLSISSSVSLSPSVSTSLSPSPSTAPIDSYTKLLLHCNGDDASKTIPDTSPSPKTVTCNGDAQLDTAQQKFGTASVLFDTTGDYLSIPDSDDWNFGTGDFTIDFWMRLNTTNVSIDIFRQYVDASNQVYCYFDGSGNIIYRIITGGVTSPDMATSTGWSTGTWYHVAIVRYGNTWNIYRNGISIANATVSITYPDLASSFYIGGNGIIGVSMNGWLDEFRISKGIARWTENFTSPTVEYGDTAISVSTSSSPSVSISKSPSVSPSVSLSLSPSLSVSPSSSISPSASISKSPSLSPSPSGDLTTVFEGLIYTFVKSSDGNTYGFDNTGCIYKRDSSGTTQRVYKDGNGSIKGAEEKPSDSGKTYLYWATNTQLNRKELPGDSGWNDVQVVGTDLQSQDWHTMKQIEGALKIANGDKLALVGYDDSYTNEALDLIPGNYAKTLVERGGHVIVGTYKAADPNKGINAAIDAEVPLAQVGDDGDIYFADGVNTIPVKRFPGGGKVNPGGVTNMIEKVDFFEWEETALSWISKQEVGNMAVFGVYGAESGKNGLYTYGRENKNQPFVLNFEYALEVDEIGAVTCVDGVLLASYRDGTSFGVMAVDSTTKAQGLYESLDFKSPSKFPVAITQWKYTELFMTPLPAGTAVGYFYKMNKTGDWTQALTGSGETTFNTSGGKKAIFSVSAEGEIFSQKIMLYPHLNDTPEIYRIRTYFQ